MFPLVTMDYWSCGMGIRGRQKRREDPHRCQGSGGMASVAQGEDLSIHSLKCHLGMADGNIDNVPVGQNEYPHSVLGRRRVRGLHPACPLILQEMLWL